MKPYQLLAIVLVMLLSPIVRAEGDATLTEAAAAEKPDKAVRLVQPWSKLTSLSEDQKQQIDQLHKQALEEMKAIRQREREQILAVLTEEQKAELQAYEEQQIADRRAAEAARKARKIDEAAQEE